MTATPAPVETPTDGLSSEEAARRLEQYGPNLVVQGRRRSVAVQLLLRFGNPLVLLLLGAAAVSGATGDIRSLVVILVMVLLSVVLDFVQEHRAGRAAERLRQQATVRATVLRDGAPRELPAADIVPGDVLLLSAGDLVPADGRLLEARDLFVNQARLTGEPFPVEKSLDGPSDPSAGKVGNAGNVGNVNKTGKAAPTEDRQAVLMGSSIVGGSARAVVLRTGRGTLLGEIGASLEKEPPPSAFEQGARSFGVLILKLALIMSLFAIGANALRSRPWLDSFLFAVALAVGLAPEMLPMVVSVTLSRGAIRMSRRKVLVKRLAAIHDLGSMDVLCTDKTGTLTEARIRIEKLIDAAGRDSRRVRELAYLNSRLQAGLRSPLDEAILACEDVNVDGWRKVDEVPFDFERRRVSVLARRGDEAPILIVKGAFEDVLKLSSRYEETDGTARPIGDETRTALLDRFETFGRDGFRVLGVAWKQQPPGCLACRREDERDLVFLGYAVFQDPPKESARGVLRSLADLGVSVRVVTGDNELVAEHVCKQLDLAVSGVLTGTEVEAMDDHALDARVEQTTLYCRVTPAQKSRILLALKRRKHVVGFLGDGINDAPALHAADVGISVDGAVDVAREAADLILLERDLGVLRDGVIEGRRTLGNIIKYILMGTSSNFGNMFSMAGAAMFLPFLPMLPIQILVNNFMYDLSEIAIPTDRVDEEFVRKPHRWDIGFIRRFMTVIGPVSSLFDALTFFLLYAVLHASEGLFQTGWFVESLSTQVLVIFVIRTRGNPLDSRPSRALALTSVLVVAAGILLPFTPLGRALGFVSPPAIFFAILVATIATYLSTVELVKRWFYRRVAPI
jgi:Mg2+-importing ATPase